MEEKIKTYTASDFARYHAGSMPAGEMYALEKAALGDPFLADALEGYAYSASPEKDIAELQERIAGKQTKKKVFSILSVAQNKWWRVAAVFIIILGVGYLFYSMNNNKTVKDTYVKNDNKKTEIRAEAPPAVLRDTSATNNDIAFEDHEASPFLKKSRITSPKSNNAIERENISASPVLKSPEFSASTSPIKDNYSSDSFTRQESKNKKETSKEYVLKGKVTDENGQPIAYANIKDEIQNKTIVTDTSGQFFLISPDSSTKVIASAIGYSSRDILLKKDAQPTIKMNRSEANLAEVAVTGYGTQRKKSLSSPSKNLQGRIAGVEIAKATIQPFPDNEKFTQYLEENLIPVYDANNKQLSGEVVLSFSINKNKRPQDISVLKSTCKECEDQAIKLLENGPDWEGKKNVTGTVEIQF